MKVRLFVFRKVGPPNVCHVAYEDVEPTEAMPDSDTIEAGNPHYPGCRVAMFSRNDTLIEVWEDPRMSSPSRYRGVMIADYRYVLHSQIEHVIRQGRMPS